MSWLLPTIRGYRRGWIRGDVIGGLAAGTVVIPQAMAYATIAGLPVEIGLYTCIVPMIIYALLGGARALSVSTTSTIAVLVATTLAGLPGAADRSDPELLRAACTLTFLVGVCLLLMRLLRLGSLVEMISPATLTGIRVGVGMTVAVGQLPALLGVPAAGESGFFRTLGHLVRELPGTDLTTVVVGGTAFALLVLLRRFAPRTPGPLVVVAGGIVLVASTSIADRSDGHGLELIDTVPTGLPLPVLPVPAEMLDLVPGALAIAVMSFMETVLVGRTNRRRTEPPIVVEQELLATGVASLIGGPAQSLPPAGGFSQSAVNLRSGARTQLSGLITAGLAVLVAIFLAPLLGDLPRSVLAAMVLAAVITLLNPADFFRYARIDRAELVVALVVAAIGLTGGMLAGVAAGVILTLVLVVRTVNSAQVRPLYRDPAGGWTVIAPTERSDQQCREHGAVVLHLDTVLYTGNALPTVERIRQLVADTPEVHTVVLDGSAVHEVTVTMLDAFRDVADELDSDGIPLMLAGFPPETAARMAKSHWFAEQQRAGKVVGTIDEALQMADRPNAEHPDQGST